MRTEHILIIRFSAMGDVVMTVPVVYALATQYPDVRITVLSREFARPFFEYMPSNVGFMAADLKREYHGVKGLNALYRRLVAKNFTAIADFHSVLRSSYLRMRFNIDRFKVAHIDKHRSGRRQLTATTNKKLVQQPTSFQNYVDVLRQLGYPVKLEFSSIYGEGKGDLELLPSAFTYRKADCDMWIGIAPFAAHKGKVYPARLMEHVIEQLTERHPHCRIMLFGGGIKEMETMAEWEGRYEQCVCASSMLGGIANELIVMSHLDVMVSMDSANMHMASIVGTPVVSVWGATHPYAGFLGWGQSMDNVVQLDLSCRPCSIYGNKPCMRGTYPCLKNISPEQIVERVEFVLKHNHVF